MAETTKATRATRLPEPGPSTSTTWQQVETPANYTRAVFLTDLEITSRRMTDELNEDTDAVAALQESIQQSRDGRRRLRARDTR